MGKGIDLARPDAPEHTKVLDDFKDQLLVVLIKRLGGKVSLPLTEVDDTSQDLLYMNVDPVARTFEFSVKRKN